MDEEAILMEALSKIDPVERESYLNEACSNDESLRKNVEGLIKAHEQAGSFLNQPAEGLTLPERSQLISEEVGTLIGPYKIREQLGEGGMGIVYAAEQEHPVRRKVALKLIKPGMDSREVIGRFEAERQALAMMDHQNIARVLDAGATESGLPYFVMELVRGVTVTEYCDKNRLSVRERLELFTQICRAVQHAHQKGIIHRDIKPSNVMVTLHDGVPIPKVIDFGVAKAINQRLTEGTVYTKVAQMLGTPAYMSPEQAELSGLDIDTRSDIYSLGVMLYELLTGSTPFTKEQLSNASFDEMRRVIRETDPQRPSERISTLKAEAMSTVANDRCHDPRKLSVLLRGELDWIVMKALEKDRNRRYETANGFAADVQRYLDDEPVVACPPSSIYRFRKFTRRNKIAIAFTSLVGVGLILGIVGMAISNHMIAQREASKQAALDQAGVNLNLAKEQEQYSHAIADFVKNEFLALASVEGQQRFDELKYLELHKDSTLKDLVDRAAKKIGTQTGIDPRIEAELKWMIGVSYRGMGQFDRSIELLSEAVELYRAAYGIDAEETLVAQNSLAVAYRTAGQYAKGLTLLKQTAEKQSVLFGDENDNTLEFMGNLAGAYQSAGQMKNALSLMERTLEKQTRKHGSDNKTTLRFMSDLAEIYNDSGHPSKALKLIEQAFKFQETKLGEDHLHTLTTMARLANSYQTDGQLELSAHYLERVVELRKNKLGPDHPATLASMNDLAVALSADEKFDEAIGLLKNTFNSAKTKLGIDHPQTLQIKGNLGNAYANIGQFDDAVKISEEVFESRKAILGDDHPATLAHMNNFVWIYTKVGRNDEAFRLLKRCVDLSKTKLGEGHSDTLFRMSNLGALFFFRGEYEQAIDLTKTVVATQIANLGEDHPHTLQTMDGLSRCYLASGRFAEALSGLERASKLSLGRFGDDHPLSMKILNNLAIYHLKMGSFDKSVPLFEKLLKISEQKWTRDHPRTRLAILGLGVNYKSAGRIYDAIPLFQELYNDSNVNPKHRLQSGINLLDAFVKLEQWNEAEGLSKEVLELIQVDFQNNKKLRATFLSQYCRDYLMKIEEYSAAETLLCESLFSQTTDSPDEWKTYATKSMLGEALYRQNKFADAETYILDGYQGMFERKAKVAPKDHSLLTRSLTRVAELYESWHLHEPKDGYDAKAAKWKKELKDYIDQLTETPILGKK